LAQAILGQCGTFHVETHKKNGASRAFAAMTLTPLSFNGCCYYRRMAFFACISALVLIPGVSAWRDSTTDSKALGTDEAPADVTHDEPAHMNASLLELAEASNFTVASGEAPSVEKGHRLVHLQYDLAEKGRLAHLNSELMELQSHQADARGDMTHGSLLRETEAILRNGAAVMHEHHGLQQQVERELPASAFPVKNKVILSAINMLAMGTLGVDRCYMGQPKLGLLKCLTCGGCCGVWTIIDVVIITVNCLESLESIDSAGFQAQFKAQDIAPAWWLTFVLLLFHAISAICAPKERVLSRDQDTSRRTSSDRRASAEAVDAFMATERPTTEQETPSAQQPAAEKAASQPVLA